MRILYIAILIITIFTAFFLFHPQTQKNVYSNSSNLSCPIFKCNIYRTGNLDFSPEKSDIDEGKGTVGSNASEGMEREIMEKNDITAGMYTVGSNAPENMERKIMDKNDSFDPSPIFVDLNLDGMDEVITFYKNTIYNSTTKKRPFLNFVMAVKYKERPTELEKLEFGEVPYIRDWFFVLPEEVHTSFSVGDLDSDGYPEVAFGSDDSNLYVLDNQGKKFFKFKTGGKVRSTPAILDLDEDGNQEIFFGSDDENIYCLDNEGKLKWKFKTGGKIESSPAFSNFIVFGSDDNNLYILDNKGKEVCKFKTMGKIRSSPLIYENKIIFGSDDQNLYITNENCNLIKKYETNGKIRSSPTVFKDYFVVGSEDENLYFFNEDEIKNVSFNSSIISTPTITKEGILVSTSNGKIYLVSLDSKKLLWENNLTKDFSCSPSVGNNNLFSCFFVQYENKDQFAGFFIDRLNKEEIKNYGKDKK